MSDADLAEQCARFFQYSSVHEWDAVARLCAPDAVFAQNGHETDLDGMLARARGTTESGIEYSYADVRRLVVEDEPAVVEQHRITMRRGDGVEANIDACVVLRFDGEGRVTRLDQYADSAAFAPLFG